jgi:hypothetical protein
MKPIDKKDMPKLVALVVLALGLFGFAIYQFTGGATATAPPPAPQPSATPTAAPVTNVEAELTPEMLQSVAMVLDGRDPFKPVGAAAPTKDTLVVPSIHAGGGVPLAAGGLVPMPILPTPAPVRASPSPEAEQVVLPPPPPPSFTLMGAIVSDRADGGRNVAIVKIGPESHYVTVGDPIGNGFVVSAIRVERGVALVEIFDPKTDRRETVKVSK